MAEFVIPVISGIFAGIVAMIVMILLGMYD
jgi:hypothetical protein